jgi:hypothetical protein
MNVSSREASRIDIKSTRHVSRSLQKKFRRKRISVWFCVLGNVLVQGWGFGFDRGLDIVGLEGLRDG